MLLIGLALYVICIVLLIWYYFGMLKKGFDLNKLMRGSKNRNEEDEKYRSPKILYPYFGIMFPTFMGINLIHKGLNFQMPNEIVKLIFTIMFIIVFFSFATMMSQYIAKKIFDSKK